MSDDQSPECEAFAALLNAVLDGDAPASALSAGHALSCRDCRELAAAARLLATAGSALRVPTPMPEELRSRLLVAVSPTRRPRWRAPALAAGVALVVGAWMLWPAAPQPVAVGPVVPDVRAPESGTAGPTKPNRVADQWDAVASVARTASEKASVSARLLTAPDVNLTTPDPLRPTADALSSIGQASKAAAEPVTDTTRRAVGLFLRDFGLSPKPAG